MLEFRRSSPGPLPSTVPDPSCPGLGPNQHRFPKGHEGRSVPPERSGDNGCKNHILSLLSGPAPVQSWRAGSEVSLTDTGCERSFRNAPHTEKDAELLRHATCVRSHKSLRGPNYGQDPGLCPPQVLSQEGLQEPQLPFRTAGTQPSIRQAAKTWRHRHHHQDPTLLSPVQSGGSGSSSPSPFTCTQYVSPFQSTESPVSPAKSIKTLPLREWSP